MRDGAAAACQAHYLKVGGSNPSPATLFHFMLYNIPPPWSLP